MPAPWEAFQDANAFQMAQADASIAAPARAPVPSTKRVWGDNEAEAAGLYETKQAVGPWMAFSQPPKTDAPTKITVTKAKPDIGAMTAFGEGVRSGVTANFSDELAGVAAAAGTPQDLQNPLSGPSDAIIGAAKLGYEYLTGGDEVAKRYTTKRDEVRDTQKAAQEQYPITNIAGQVAGAVALPVGGMLGAATLPARMGRGAAVGAGFGAGSGLGAGEDMQDRATRGATGLAAGGLVGAAAPVALKGVELAGQGIAAAARPIATSIRGMRDPDAEAARRVLTARNRDVRAGDAGLTDAEFAAAQQSGIPVANVDQGGATTRSLARSAANTSPEARGALERMTDDRFVTQGPRSVDFVTSLVRTPANAGKTREALEDTARTARKPFYDRAYSQGAGGILDGELQQLSGAPAMQDAIKAAISQAQNRLASRRAGPMVSPDGQRPTLEFWDLVQRQLRQKIDVAKRAGASEDVMELTGIRNALVSKLDTAVPDFAKARGVAAELFKAEGALEAGEKFVTSGTSREVARVLSKMGPEERELFAEGFVSAFVEKINKVGDRRSVLNQINQSADAKQRFELVLGPQKFKEMEARMRVESIMDKMRGALGNSTTARQLIEAGLAGGASLGVSGDPTQAASVAGMWFALRQGGKFLNQRVDQNVSRRVGEMLASNDPKVLQKGIALVAKNSKMMELLRAADNASARVGGQNAPTLPALQSPAPSRAEDEQPNVPRIPAN